MTTAPTPSEAERIAATLSEGQRKELLHYEPGEGFMPPRKAAVALYMWRGIFPRGSSLPAFLLRRLQHDCLYDLTPLGEQVRNILQNQGADHGK